MNTEDDDESANFIPISIPIDLSMRYSVIYNRIASFNTLIHMTNTLFSLSPQTDDILMAINELRELHAFMIMSNTYSYEDQSTKQTSSLLSSDKLKVF